MAVDLKYGRVTTERGTIGDDEPVVVFRAQDRLLPKLLKVYKILCELAGSPAHHVEAIHDAAVGVKAWQATHATKTPSSDSIAPAVEFVGYGGVRQSGPPAGLAKFAVGDKVAMPDVPMTVEVLEIGTCSDGPACPLGTETFRFDDPAGHGDDWMHSSQFEKVGDPE